MSQTVLDTSQNPEEVGTSASEGTNSTKRMGASRQRAVASLFHVLYIDCHQEVGARFKVGISTLNDPIKKKFLQVYPEAQVGVNSR